MLARDADMEKAVDKQIHLRAGHELGRRRRFRRPALGVISRHAHTHLDALGHHFLNGKLYNGFAAAST